MSQLDSMHTKVKQAKDECSWIESVNEGNEDGAERKFIDLMQSTLLLLLLYDFRLAIPHRWATQKLARLPSAVAKEVIKSIFDSDQWFE